MSDFRDDFDDDDDIFRSAFSSASATGKVKIDAGPVHGSPFCASTAAAAASTKCEEEEKKDSPKNSVVESVGIAGIAASRHFMRDDEYSSSPDEDFEATSAEAAALQSEEQERDSGDKFIEISVSEPHKVGEGMSSFVAYRVTTRTNMQPFTKSQYTVTRRFSDFLGVHEKLAEKHARRGRIIPPAPEKSLVGTTKVKMSSDNTSSNSTAAEMNNDGDQQQQNRSSEKEFLSRRRFALERFINRVVQHPVLRRDSDVVEFLESVRELPRATSTSALSSASVFRLLGRVGDTVNKMTYKMEETDPWYEDKLAQLEGLEVQLRKLYVLAESVAGCRRDLAIATGSFAQSIALLSNTEEAHTLSRAMAHLARVEEKVEQVHHCQADADHVHLFELIKDYVGLMGAVKDAMGERHKAFQTWQHAQSMVIRKKEQRARLEMGGRTDKIPAANEEVVEWENRLEEGQANFNKISDVIKVEVDFFERYRVKDFKLAIIEYMQVLMECQVQMVKHWEEFLPEVKNILF